MSGLMDWRTTTSGVVRDVSSLGVLAGVVALTMGLSWPAMAQVPTEAQPGVVDRPVPPRAPPELKKKPVQIERLTPKREAVPDAGVVVATIKKINFKGMSVIAEADLQAAVAKYLDRPITRGEMAQLKFDVTRLYYDRGFILVRAVTPPQDLTDGVLDVVIYEARVGTITVRNDDTLRQWVVDALTSAVQPGAVFDEQSVESMVNDFNDFNNVDASLNLRQGKAVGTTDLLLNVVRADEDEQSVSVDNYGSEITGEVVGRVNLEKSNLLGVGEKFDLDATISEDRTWSVAGSVKLPVGFRNVMFDARAFHSNIEVGDRLASLDADGETQIYEAALSSRLVNMRRQILQVRGGLQVREHKSFQANIVSTDDDIRQIFLETSYLARFPDLFLFGSLRLAKGVDIFSASKKGRVNATVAEGDPEVFLVQPLIFANYRPVDNGELRVLVTGQIAGSKTLSSDLFSLGGYGSVRGFEPAETTGEAGVQFSVEYNHTVWSGEWQGAELKAALGPFVDGGHVWPRADPSTRLDHTLVAAGLGAEVETGASTVGTTKLRFDWAHTLGSYQSPEVDNNTFYLRLSQTF